MERSHSRSHQKLRLHLQNALNACPVCARGCICTSLNFQFITIPIMLRSVALSAGVLVSFQMHYGQYYDMVIARVSAIS